MKTLFRSSLAFFLVLVLLAAGSGATIGRMVCLKSGRSIVRLQPVNDCCAERTQKTSTIGDHCCSIQNFVLQTDQYLFQKISFDQPLAILPAISFAAQDWMTALQARHASFFVADRPPPPGGKILLQRLHTFLV
jgi:hypothetical protein